MSTLSLLPQCQVGLAQALLQAGGLPAAGYGSEPEGQVGSGKRWVFAGAVGFKAAPLGLKKGERHAERA